MKTKQETGQNRKLLWWQLFGSVCFAAAAIMLIALLANQPKECEKTECQKTSDKILQNQMLEAAQLNSRQWDLNEWLPIHNVHLQTRYNLLLEFNNEPLSQKVFAQELCLKQLYKFNESGDQNTARAILDRCIKLDDEIQAALLGVLTERIEE